ncbi:MAG: hypothetical protein QXW97_02240 [Candidatus Pacearchaeota archaeon]
MGWFFGNKKNKEESSSIPELPNLPPEKFSTSPYENQNISPSITTPDIPYPPINEKEKNKIDFSLMPATREIEDSEKDYIKEPKPGMQKSKFQYFQPSYSQPEMPETDYSIPNSLTKQIKQPSTQFETKPSIYQEQQKITNPLFKKSIKNLEKREEPVYIRLDKFQLTINTFRELKEKIKEIENLLSKIREIKAREDKELDEWEREIETIKIKIESIDKEIFENQD